jgi:eukaryotic-like serine/threonine-protein kinase
VGREDGKVLWTFATRGKVDSSPAVCGNRVVVGSDDGRLYMVDLGDGSEIWRYEIGESLTASPAVAGGRIVIGSEDGKVYAFGAKGAGGS